MIEFFLHRPVFASVCALFIILAGLISIPTLPVAQFPQVAPPVVTVTANYIGANAQAAESSVTTPLEEAINGVDGLRYISSSTTSDGTSTIVCTFQLDRNIDLAANDVQNQVNNTFGRLPAEVRATGVTVTKNSGTFVIAMGLASTDARYDRVFISNYAANNIVDVIKRIRGVNDVRIFGERRYAMRLWLDPVAPQPEPPRPPPTSSRALQTQNVQIAAGAIGSAPIRTDQPYQISVRAIGRLRTPEQFGNLILRSNPDAGFVRLRDVGRVELGAESYAQDLRLSRNDAIGIAVLTLPSANALQVASDVRATMDKLSQRFPHGITYQFGFDATPFVSRVDPRGAQDAGDLDRPRDRGRVPVPAVVAHDADPGDHDPGLAHRHVRADEGARLLDQHAHAVRPHARDRPGGRRRDRRDREHRALRQREGDGSLRTAPRPR